MMRSRLLHVVIVLVATGTFAGGCGSSGDTNAGDASADATPPDGSSGDGGASGDGSHDGAPIDATGDAIPPADGPFACGNTTCGATQFCEHPCCGGAQPQCEPALDGGQCPAGTHTDSTCIGQSGGCRPDPCTPPAPFCTDKATDTGCTRQGHDLICMCA